VKARNNLKSNDAKPRGDNDNSQGCNKHTQPCKRGGTKQESKLEAHNVPKQYSAPAEKTMLHASVHDNNSDNDSSEDGYNTWSKPIWSTKTILPASHKTNVTAISSATMVPTHG